MRRGPVTQPRVWIYASFAAAAGGGNPAGVVVSAEAIDAMVAQTIAATLCVPTTGFVVADDAAHEGRASVRFFTPRVEIDACGHVMVAVATALVELGIWNWGSDVSVHARRADFPLRLDQGNVEIAQRLRLLEPATVAWRDVERTLGSVRRHAELPLALSAAGLRHLIVPVRDVHALSHITVEPDRIAVLAAQADADTICVWSFDSDRRVHLRDLCAGIGAVEEPASGTTAAALALYLTRYADVDGELIVEQGVDIGRPSRIEVALRAPDVAIVRGSAQRIVHGALDLASHELPASTTESA